MKIGYKLIAEAYSPQEMVSQAVRAEEAGFDFVEISDHFHPWFDSQDHSGFAWSTSLRRPCAPNASGSPPASPVLSSVTTPQ
jgi:alkanesulfonate monooxygenase SsuD/methylene tetrahydromethanopterin reductase-like flavin-dependent oxidoreductase (luciferase family)